MPDAIDSLGAVLEDVRVSYGFTWRSELGGAWGVEVPALEMAEFHYLAEGEAWLWTDDRRLHLERGDLVLMPRGPRHSLGDRPGRPTVGLWDLPGEQIGERAAILRINAPERGAVFISAGTVVRPANHPLLSSLPDLIHLEAPDGEPEVWVTSTLESLAEEALRPRLGSPALVTRLCEIMLIGAMRAYVERSPEARVGWYGALTDPQIGHALALMHADVSEGWTVGRLAAAINMSRAAFAARFHELVGMPPMHYLTRWRMHLAAQWIRHDKQLGLAEVAERLGYGSEAAFSRAFKRHMGVPPGTLRKRKVTPPAWSRVTHQMKGESG